MNNVLKPGDLCLLIDPGHPMSGKTVTLVKIYEGCLTPISLLYGHWCPHWIVEETQDWGFSWKVLMKLSGEGDQVVEEEEAVV